MDAPEVVWKTKLLNDPMVKDSILDFLDYQTDLIKIFKDKNYL
jgi:hypothetical protein